MAKLKGVLRQLQRERDRVQTELARIDDAIAAIGKVAGNSSKAGATLGRPARRRLSAAARRRIARAQKARWAKYRQEQV